MIVAPDRSGAQWERGYASFRGSREGTDESLKLRFETVSRLTQQQLAQQLGVTHQTLAHYEVGRARLPASLSPELARLLTRSLDELVGNKMARSTRSRPRGPASRLHQQIDAIEQLPRTEQQFVSQMLETVLAQAGR